MAGSTQKTRWASDNPSGTPVHIVRHHCQPGYGWSPHDHDFLECFWVERGRGLHVVDGREYPLRLGHICFIRPEYCHQGIADAGGMVICNLSFLATSVRSLRQRAGDGWPWRNRDPSPVLLPPNRLDRLRLWADDIVRSGERAIDLEAFLTDLLRIMADRQEADTAGPLPEWLSEGLAAFNCDEHLHGGVQRLAALCGRGHDHINRVLQRCRGRSSTEMVTDLRLERAALALRMGDRSIENIADLIGMPNLGHFYKRFKARYHCTPAQYRRRARSVLPH